MNVRLKNLLKFLSSLYDVIKIKRESVFVIRPDRDSWVLKGRENFMEILKDDFKNEKRNRDIQSNGVIDWKIFRLKKDTTRKVDFIVRY